MVFLGECLGGLFFEVDPQTGAGDVFEHLRRPDYLKQQEEQLLFFLQVLLQSLSVDAGDQVPDEGRVTSIANEDSVSLVHDDRAEEGPDGKGGTKVKTEDRS